MSSICLGIRMITDDHKIGYPIRDFFIKNYDKIPFKLADPLMLCVACMASIWGSLIFWSLWVFFDGYFNWFDLFQWVSCCLVTSFVNGFTWALFELVRKY